VRDHVERSRYANIPDPPGYREMLARIKAKLIAFTEPPSSTLAKYPETDRSVLARYARAIAYYREPDLADAVPAIDALIREMPSDPYFRELKGQMLFENGRIAEAAAPYEYAVRLDPQAPLLRVGLAQVYLEADDPAKTKRAIAYLSDALRTEDKDVDAWHLLATAYGRDHQMGMAALSLAEEGLAADNKTTATQQAIRAEQLLPRTSAAHGRAQQIHLQAKELDDSD
jgi:predicted Zn-dependent protease